MTLDRYALSIHPNHQNIAAIIGIDNAINLRLIFDDNDGIMNKRKRKNHITDYECRNSMRTWILGGLVFGKKEISLGSHFKKK